MTSTIMPANTWSWPVNGRKIVRTDWPPAQVSTRATKPARRWNRPSSNPHGRAHNKGLMMWYTGSRGTVGRGWWWYTWTSSQLIRELLGTSGLKEGAVVVVGEKSPQGKTEQLEGRWDIASRALRRRNDGTPVGSSGQIASRRGKCYAYAHC
jgi:hypothetical protein